MRGCAFANAKGEECSVNNPGKSGEFKTCYKTCGTPLCNTDSMDKTFPSFSINCLHCSTTVQSWCMDLMELGDHLKDTEVVKKCWSGTCSTIRSGK